MTAAEQVLEGLGVERVEALGKMFDARQHDAVQMQVERVASRIKGQGCKLATLVGLSLGLARLELSGNPC